MRFIAGPLNKQLLQNLLGEVILLGNTHIDLLPVRCLKPNKFSAFFWRAQVMSAMSAAALTHS
ncbi:phospholipase D/Transphosphatidylase [Castellaniella defragrans 65Phen]|uniref:Phospholipase D/Transphosphatidylase n=1 Tax=Castellaniella defragrans (strain DSM 12143 / CCUG 39792 / 65Phen) TaxID=1437824 RepID=W8WVG2_CASD6|nr:phospholipase D/Transphosphatidylase [Castellaniella defragrans 65Phen]